MLTFKTAIFRVGFLACPVKFSSISQVMTCHVEAHPAITEVVITCHLRCSSYNCSLKALNWGSEQSGRDFHCCCTWDLFRVNESVMGLPPSSQTVSVDPLQSLTMGSEFSMDSYVRETTPQGCKIILAHLALSSNCWYGR